MFFSSVLFTKRGNLAKVWLAAHHQDKRLSKAIVVSTNIEECSHEVSEPTVPLSLRISGQLLLGVVRIYQRKVRYLQEDTQEALTKVRMSSRPGPGALELPPSHATAASSHITFTDAADNDFLDFAIPDIPLNRLESLCEDEFAQHELTRANDMNLEPDDQFSYNLGIDHAAKQFEDQHDVLMAGEEEDIIHMEPFEDAGDKIDQSIEIGRDAPDFAIDDLPPINIELADEASKHGDMESVLPPDDVEIAEEPIPLLEVSHTENDRSVLGSVEPAPDLEGEINVSVKKTRKRKRPKHDRSTQLTSSEIMDQDTSKLVVVKVQRIDEPEPIAASDLPAFLLSDAIGPLADPLTAFIAESFRKGTTDTAMEQAAVDQVAEIHDENQDIISEPHQQLNDDAAAPFYDDALPVAVHDDQPVVDDDDQRQFEESFISAPPPDAEEPLPLPDLTVEDEQREDDDTPPSNAFSTWSDRTKKMCVLLSERLNRTDSEIHLHSLIEGKPRSTAAVIFLETLILKSFDFIDLDQQQPYGEIAIKRASRFRDGASVADMLAITG